MERKTHTEHSLRLNERHAWIQCEDRWSIDSLGKITSARLLFIVSTLACLSSLILITYVWIDEKNKHVWISSDNRNHFAIDIFSELYTVLNRRRVFFFDRSIQWMWTVMLTWSNMIMRSKVCRSVTVLIRRCMSTIELVKCYKNNQSIDAND